MNHTIRRRVTAPTDRRSRRATARGLGMALSLALPAGACVDASSDRVLGVDATAAITAQVRLDANGNGVVDPAEPGVPGVRIGLRIAGTSHVLTSPPSDATGALRVEEIPVGSYAVEIDAAAVSDSLEIVLASHTDLVLAANSENQVTVLLSFPRTTVAGARATGRCPGPAGRWGTSGARGRGFRSARSGPATG